MEPIIPAIEPPMIASTIARITFAGGLKANGANKPGIGEAVPGALFTIPNAAAASPASPPPKKLEVKIGIGLAVIMSACVSGSNITAMILLSSPNFKPLKIRPFVDFLSSVPVATMSPM